MRNDDKELIGINKNKSSKINLIFEDKGIETITFFNQVEGDIFPKQNSLKTVGHMRLSLAR
jgi:DNA-directed RNA polymerase